jgi:hypothetical protein
MRLNVKSDDLNIEIKTILKKQIYVEELEKFFRKKFTDKLMKKNYFEENFVFYDIDENRILRKTEAINIYSKRELNLKLLKHIKIDKEVPFTVNKPKIEDMISEITGAQEKLKREKLNKSSKLFSKQKSSFAYL